MPSLHSTSGLKIWLTDGTRPHHQAALRPQSTLSLAIVSLILDPWDHGSPISALISYGSSIGALHRGSEHTTWPLGCMS